MNPLITIFLLALLVEALVEYFATPVPSAYKPYAAALVGVALCLLYNADLLVVLGLPAALPYAGAVLTGLIISRGANALNDLFARIRRIGAPISTTTVINPVVQERVASVETEVRHDPA